VQYAKMIDLIEAAEVAGEQQTEFVNEKLADAFDIWLSDQDLGEITEEEEDALRRAFEKGFGICVHHLSADRQDQA
jgi:regulator of replication initiation timing